MQVPLPAWANLGCFKIDKEVLASWNIVGHISVLFWMVFSPWSFWPSFAPSHIGNFNGVCFVLFEVLFLLCFQSLVRLEQIRYGTFVRQWNQKWTVVLKFRDQNSFSQYDVCQELKQQLLGVSLHPENVFCRVSKYLMMLYLISNT